MWRRFATCVSIVASSLMCTGCWDSTEIDRLSIVTMTGVDVAEDGQSVLGSVQIARASELGTTGGGSPATSTGSAKAYLVESAEGPTEVEVMAKIRSSLPRKLFMGHRRVIVIGEDYARRGVGQLLDEIVRNPQSRLRTYVVVAFHEQAQKMLQVPSDLNRLPSDAVVELEQSGSVVAMDARRFAKQLTSHSDPYAMGIAMFTNEMSEASPEALTLENIAVFQRDKLVDWLQGEAAKGFLWISRDLRDDSETVTLPDNRGKVSVRLGSVRTSHHVKIVRGQPELNINLHAIFDINQNASRLNLLQPNQMDVVRKALQAKIQSQIASAMQQLQRDQADPLGVSNELFKYNPGLWRRLEPRWREVYAAMPIHYNIDINIRNAGLMSSSL
ncbi:germination protein, Ger(x)C family [Alicyclobacillus hesperidum URH17-3-68]|uniref:Germination protein, Ger(X)C family n=1 Tax=Alicyclobacillus hesperidum TaxID=89784 RepID=A0A1H2ULF8_9BACL|nr:Ger(x)C family spore germination protein [Alicyclobacillus hesperidum]EJY54855.1 germination protein, Ger(x)C family [Alicyclobacillus hesperidum URH17-3-68]GLV14382.1 putative spore germination protein YfkR [Alicyclobacillus hesperidum]SDW56788.1 germination protein, Ger(x)C family [Alicyclobacillus hesperidum]